MGRPAIPLEEKLLAGIEIQGECWVFTRGSSNSAGHKTIESCGKRIGAHRAAYGVWVDDIPDGLWVLHHCDNPPCVNPDHLFIGTQLDNANDCVSKGRAGLHGRGNGITHSVCGTTLAVSPKGQKYCPKCCNNSKKKELAGATFGPCCGRYFKKLSGLVTHQKTHETVKGE